jgi:hypothetical protein
MKRKRVDFASPSMVLEVKSKRRQRRGTEKEWIEAIIDAQIRSSSNLNWHFNEQRRERERGLRSNNETRRRKAERDYQKYRDIAEMLIAGNPQLDRATRHRLAKEVQAELAKRGRVVSTRTISEALRPKNKV